MKKSFFILTLVTLALWGCRKAESLAPTHITLTWMGDPHTTQTVTWTSDSTEKEGQIRFTLKDQRAALEQQTTIAQDSSKIFTTELGSYRIHTKTIKGLTPGTSYCYQVGANKQWSDAASFTTEADNSTNFKFLIFGDSQSGIGTPEAQETDYSDFKTTIHKAYQANPDAKFFINMGDLVEIGNYYSHWNRWFEASKDIINNISFMPVQGNHETFKSGYDTTSKPTNFTSQFNLPQNGPEGFLGQVYSYDYGQIHFSVLDSQINEEEQFDPKMAAKEVQWLENDLQKTSKQWKIVLFHKCPYYNKTNRANDAIKALFQPVIDKYHVDMVLNGHDHAVSWTYPIKDDQFMTKPSQGTVYYIAGRSGHKTYSNLVPKFWDAFYFDPKVNPNYVVAQVNDTQLKLIAYNQDATPIDTLIIDKSRDEIIHGNTPLLDVPQFKTPKISLFGVLDTVNTPVKIGNKWYVPIDLLNTSLGYKATVSMNVVMLSKESHE